jgi:hypothetical protein
MDMNKRFSILLAVLALIASTLACAAGEPTLSNVRTAHDADGKDTATVFSPTDTIYVVSDLANGKQGNVVSSKWMVSNVEGYDPGFVIDEVDITLDQDQLSYSINFYFEPPTDGWPVGTYKVEVYFNSVLNSTVEFTVQ